MDIRFTNGHQLVLCQGDITTIVADAIANAANADLAGGGGVDGAIHQAGGPAIMAELDQIRDEQGGCPTGCAVATTAGKLPAKYVFHAVGPIYRGGQNGEAALLASCYRECLRLAEEHGVRRIAFPSISTGVYGYPVSEAAHIAIETVASHLASGGSVETVIFVLFDRNTLQGYKQALTAYQKNRLN